MLDLPKAEKQLDNVKFKVDDKDYDLFDFMALDNMTAMLVLKDGKIAYETYQRGNTEKTRWMSMSVAKSITSTLTGIAIKEGLIDGLDAPVTKFVPALNGSAYDGVSVKNVLMMSSGVKWNETYTDPASDRRALLKAQISQEPGSAMKLMASLPRAAEPGRLTTTAPARPRCSGRSSMARSRSRWPITCRRKSGCRSVWKQTRRGGWIRLTVSRSAAAGSAPHCATMAASACSLPMAGRSTANRSCRTTGPRKHQNQPS